MGAFTKIKSVFGTSPLKSVMSKLTGVKTPDTTGAKTEKTAEAPKPAPQDNSSQQIVQKLDELINLMKNGGISVNIDGKKASYALAKASA